MLCYDLTQPARLWEENANFGFYSWGLHNNVVIMAAELELAAWNTTGRKLWTRFVEPPWDYRVDGDMVIVDVMGSISRIRLRDGMPA